jgi:hypothetical protein
MELWIKPTIRYFLLGNSSHRSYAICQTRKRRFKTRYLVLSVRSTNPCLVLCRTSRVTNYCSSIRAKSIRIIFVWQHSFTTVICIHILCRLAKCAKFLKLRYGRIQDEHTLMTVFHWVAWYQAVLLCGNIL